ncbi:MAG: S8 family serine peptidase, partial [Patescibacteria group bacterium]
MKKAQKTIHSLLIACLAFSFTLGTFSFLPTPVSAASEEREQRNTDQPYVDGEVIVKYKKESINLETSYGKMAAAFHSIQTAAVKMDEIEDGNIAVLEIKDGSSVEQKIAELRRDSRVEYAEPNYRREPNIITTNDTYRELLWGLDNTGQSINGLSGTADADMDVPEAWATNEGTQGEVIVAIIDTGVAYTHEDLAQNMWDGSQCVNESGNALGGCVHGYDFEFEDKDPDPSDNKFGYARFHGTHVAGTIAATKNNSTGTIGIAPRAKIMALKSALESEELVRAVDFARHNGAKVINASYGGGEFSQA